MRKKWTQEKNKAEDGWETASVAERVAQGRRYSLLEEMTFEQRFK